MNFALAMRGAWLVDVFGAGVVVPLVVVAGAVVVGVVVVVVVPPPVPSEKASAGWSSIPFGATPVWPWITSKKPTPVTVALPERLVKELPGTPTAEMSAARADAISVTWGELIAP